MSREITPNSFVFMHAQKFTDQFHGINDTVASFRRKTPLENGGNSSALIRSSTRQNTAIIKFIEGHGFFSTKVDVALYHRFRKVAHGVNKGFSFTHWVRLYNYKLQIANFEL